MVGNGPAFFFPGSALWPVWVACLVLRCLLLRSSGRAPGRPLPYIPRSGVSPLARLTAYVLGTPQRRPDGISLETPRRGAPPNRHADHPAEARHGTEGTWQAGGRSKQGGSPGGPSGAGCAGGRVVPRDVGHSHSLPPGRLPGRARVGDRHPFPARAERGVALAPGPQRRAVALAPWRTAHAAARRRWGAPRTASARRHPRCRPSSAARCPRRWFRGAPGRPPGPPPDAGCSSAAWSRRGSTSRTSSCGDSSPADGGDLRSPPSAGLCYLGTISGSRDRSRSRPAGRPLRSRSRTRPVSSSRRRRTESRTPRPVPPRSVAPGCCGTG